MSWLGIIAAAIIVAATVFWAFVGHIPSTVTASGFLTAPYNTNTVFSTVAGKIQSIEVFEGKLVSKGDVLLKVKDYSGKMMTVKSDQDGIVSKLLLPEEGVIHSNIGIASLSPITDQDLVVVCYVGLETSKVLHPGMTAEVYLNSKDSGIYGHMEAEISNIDSFISSRDSMGAILGSDGQMAEYLTQNGPVVAVTCVLRPDEKSRSGYYFSSDKGKDLTISNGEPVSVQIIMSDKAPISKVFPMWGNRDE